VSISKSLFYFMTLLFLVSSFVEVCLIFSSFGSWFISLQAQPSRNYTKFCLEGWAWASWAPRRSSREAQSFREKLFWEAFCCFANIHGRSGNWFECGKLSFCFSQNIDLMHSEFQTNNGCWCNKKIIEIVWKILLCFQWLTTSSFDMECCFLYPVGSWLTYPFLSLVLVV